MRVVYLQSVMTTVAAFRVGEMGMVLVELLLTHFRFDFLGADLRQSHVQRGVNSVTVDGAGFFGSAYEQSAGK